MTMTRDRARTWVILFGIISLLMMFGSGCHVGDSTGDAGVSAEGDAFEDGGAKDTVMPEGDRDSGVDADAGDTEDVIDIADGAEESRQESTCPVVIDGACAPVGIAETILLSDQPGIEMPGVSFVWPEGPLFVVFPHYDTGRILGAKSDDIVDFSFSPAEPFPPSLASDTTGAKVGGERILFYYGRSGSTGTLALRRAVIGADGVLGVSTEVKISGADGITPYWPQAVGLVDGRILIGFVESATDANRRAYFGVSEDAGQSFAMQVAPSGTGARLGILVHVGLTADGSWVFTWQESDASFLYFTSYVQLSSDEGETWSRPVKIVPDKDNVHDAFPVARRDAGTDLYYLAQTNGNLNVFRRSMTEDAILGPEQRVTAAELGHIEKPQPRRLPDGRLGMVASRRLAVDDYRVFFVVLDGDAPLK